VLTIVVHEKGGKTQRVTFGSDQFTVGREDDNDLILDRVNVSKQHVRLRRVQGAIELIDLGSTNGTYVNGRKVESVRAIRRSDRIYVGDYILMLEGDDARIAPLERAEFHGISTDGQMQKVQVAIPARPTGPQTDLGIEEDDSLVTSASRVAAPGLESAYLDEIADRILQTVLVNVSSLNPLSSTVATDADREKASRLVETLLDDMREAGEMEKGVDDEPLKTRVLRELLDLGPLQRIMRDDEVREVQVVGGGPIKVVNEAQSEAELIEDRFCGDRALILAIQRMAAKGGFLREGAQIVEGKVSDGFYMYALLPPTQVRTPVLSLRRTRTDANTLAALVQEGVLSNDIRELISAAVRGNRRILICASGGVNLDRFMGAVAGEVPDNKRVACISDTGRLGASRTSWVQVRRISDPADTVGLSDSLGLLLRGGLDLLISQRCRHEDAAAVIDAVSGAASGAIVSVWGIDSAHALSRLAALSTVASGAIQALTVSLARSVDLLVRLSVGVNGEAMQVVEVVEPQVSENDAITHVSLFRSVKGTEGVTDFLPTGTVPGFFEELEGRGITVTRKVFEP